MGLRRMRAVTHDTLRRYLCRQLRIEPEDFPAESALFSSGLLDSFAMADLVSQIEVKEDIVVPPEDFTLENFDSINRIVAYLDARDKRG